MGERTSTLTFLARDAASGAIKDINSALGGMKTHAAGAGKALGGAAVNIAKIGAAAAAAGILALGAGLAYAAKQAAEEEKGIVRLNAAIKANTTTTKDNTAAINKAIAAGEKKAFSDDDQREALARLVTSTKDVAEAITLNALAMDLARLKGIDLATAANIVGKVHDGNIGILTRYGITVDKGATSTEALAAIQAAAAGQADAYGKTTAGSFESIQLAIDNVIEDIGAALLPVLSTAAAYFRDNLVPALQLVGAQFGQWVKDNQPLIDQIGTFVTTTLTNLVTYVTGTVIPIWGALIGKFVEFAGKIVADVGPTIVAIGTKLGELGAIIVGEIIPIIVDFATRVWEGGLNKAVKVAGELIGTAIDWLVKLAGWITSNDAIMAVLSAAADLIGTAFGVAADAISLALDFVGKLGDAITSNEDVMKGLETLGLGIGAAFEIAGDFIAGVDRALRTLVQWARDNLDIINLITGQSGTGQGAYPSNIGGPAAPSHTVGGNTWSPGGINRANGAALTLAPGAIVVNGAGDPEAVARSVMLALKRETLRQGMSF